MGLLNALPGAVAQGLIWGIMAMGLYISYKILDIADLTVDGSICTGACVCAILLTNGVNVYLCVLLALLAGALAGVVTGIFHTLMGIPGILAGILTQLILWSLNLKILGKANLSISSRNYNVLLTSLRNGEAIAVGIAVCAITIVVLFLFFYTEIGLSV
ncbi:MAG: ABC transporter permease, partial [Oscillospiraceae bacterium]|nr:ABC transporter permease [Oscillospiraceae bacterium]